MPNQTPVYFLEMQYVQHYLVSPVSPHKQISCSRFIFFHHLLILQGFWPRDHPFGISGEKAVPPGPVVAQHLPPADNTRHIKASFSVV